MDEDLTLRDFLEAKANKLRDIISLQKEEIMVASMREECSIRAYIRGLEDAIRILEE